MDELIAQYAAELQEIYDDRTAGDYTFTGVLAEFLLACENAKRDAFVGAFIKVNEPKQPPLCRCGYRADSLVDFDGHIMAMVIANDERDHG